MHKCGENYVFIQMSEKTVEEQRGTFSKTLKLVPTTE